MVGLVCRPKKESLIDVPPGPDVTCFWRGGLEGRTPLLSLFVPDTEDLTAANTTLAKDIPDVEPKYLESEAPWTETLPMLETSLLSLSDSSCFLFHAACLGDCFCDVSDVSLPLNVGLPSSLGVCTVFGSGPGLEA